MQGGLWSGRPSWLAFSWSPRVCWLAHGMCSTLGRRLAALPRSGRRHRPRRTRHRPSRRQQTRIGRHCRARHVRDRAPGTGNGRTTTRRMRRQLIHRLRAAPPPACSPSSIKRAPRLASPPTRLARIWIPALANTICSWPTAAACRINAQVNLHWATERPLLECTGPQQARMLARAVRYRPPRRPSRSWLSG